MLCRVKNSIWGATLLRVRDESKKKTTEDISKKYIGNILNFNSIYLRSKLVREGFYLQKMSLKIVQQQHSNVYLY